jgi:hypothetical protein
MLRAIIKVVNYSHLFPTRYALELEGLKGSVAADTFKEPTQREDAKKTIKKLLEDRYTAGKNRWFFTPLRVSCSIVRDILYYADSVPVLNGAVDYAFSYKLLYGS